MNLQKYLYLNIFYKYLYLDIFYKYFCTIYLKYFNFLFYLTLI